MAARAMRSADNDSTASGAKVIGCVDREKKQPETPAVGELAGDAVMAVVVMM